MAYKTNEQLIREIAKLRADKERQNRMLKTKRDTLMDFKKMNAEKRELKRELFELKNAKKIAVARGVGTGARKVGKGLSIVGSELGKGLKSYHKYRQSQNKLSKKRK